MSYYCGNNHTVAFIRQQPIGNRYQCLQQGIGKGINSKINKEYALPFFPIDNRKIYCGRRNQLPNGYHWIGRNSDCFQKGFGLGQLNALETRRSYNWIIKILYILSIGCLLFSICYYIYMSIIHKKYFIFICMVVGVVYLLFYYFLL